MTTEELDLAAWRVFFRMSQRGLLVSVDRLEELLTNVRSQMAGQLAVIDALAGRPLNPSSGDEVAEWMTEVGLRGKLTKTGTRLATDERSLAGHDHPVLKAVVEHRGLSKLESAFINPLLRYARQSPDNVIHPRWKLTRVRSGRPACEAPNFLQMPSREELGKRVRGCFIARPGYKLASADLCLAPHTLVLTADLRWVRIDSLQIGQKLVGIEEHGINRKMLTAVVKRLGRRTAFCYRITTSDGREIVASAEHPWLARNFRIAAGGTRSRWRWVRTEHLRAGDKLCKLSSPWTADDTREGGWLAGMLDGEGSFHRENGMITFTQNPGPINDAVVDKLQQRGYSFTKSQHRSGFKPGSSAWQSWMCGVPDCMHLIGTLRPMRFLQDVERLWVGKQARQMKYGKVSPVGEFRPSVTAVVPIGEMEVVSMETDTHTFVAEGFYTHNSQVEPRMTAALSQDAKLLAIFRDGRDLYTEVAADLGVPRQVAKIITLGTLYGMGPSRLFEQLILAGCGTNASPTYDMEACAALLDSWFETYAGVKTLVAQTVTAAKANGGWAKTMGGRGRYLPALFIPGARWPESKLREEAERQAFNHLIQGTCSERMKMAMLRVDGLAEVHPLLQVYDELICEVPEEYAEDCAATVAALMEETYAGVRLKSSWTVGDDWGQLK